MEEVINELRSKLDIVTVISSYIPLTKKGHNYVGLCPFHNDHTASLTVSPDKQIYKCFACGEGGNVFQFVSKYEHVSFKESLKILANQYSIDIGEFKDEKNDTNAKLYEVMDLANAFFQNNLISKEGANAREYLTKRGLTSEVIKEFGIGLSLNKIDMLTKLLTSKGISLETLNSIDLSNTNHDSYINRVMFPLHDKDGRVIGFSGRIYDNSDYNKYQNSKETILFKKREVLYNLHRAREDIRKEKSVIVMEGFMASIRAYINGIRNVVAEMGTALSSEQANMIKRLSNNIYLCYDGDNAGRKATLTNGEIFLKMGCNVNVIVLSDNLDPDDYILKYGIDSFKNLINNAISFTDFKIRNLKNGYDINDIEGKTKYVNQILLEIVKENDEIKREIMLKRLASETDIWYNTLEKKLMELVEGNKKAISLDDERVSNKRKTGINKAMESIVYYMLTYPEAITLVDDSNVYFPDRNIRLLVNEIIAYHERFGKISIADFYTFMGDNEELFDVLKKILSYDYSDDVTTDLVKENLTAIKNYNIALEIKDLEKRIKEEVDIDEQMKLMDKIRALKMKEG